MAEATGKQKAGIGGAVALIAAATGAYTAFHGTHTTSTAVTRNDTPLVINRPHDASGSPLPVTVTQAPNGGPPIVIVGNGAPGGCVRAKAANSQPLPDKTCTPGVTRVVSVTVVCTPGSAADARKVTSTEKEDVLTSYGDTAPYKGEIDHLISLQLGGSNDEKNLWPEPGSIPNVKDATENRLHAWVCKPTDTTTRTTRLKAAQQAIRTDWTTAERIITP